MSKPKEENQPDADNKAIKEELEKTKAVAERVEANQDRDRKDFQEFNSKLQHWETQMKILQEVINDLPKIIKDKVEEVVQPIRKEVKDLQDVFEGKKIVAIDAQKTKDQLKHWWEFWK